MRRKEQRENETKTKTLICFCFLRNNDLWVSTGRYRMRSLCHSYLGDDVYHALPRSLQKLCSLTMNWQNRFRNVRLAIKEGNRYSFISCLSPKNAAHLWQCLEHCLYWDWRGASSRPSCTQPIQGKFQVRSARS